MSGRALRCLAFLCNPSTNSEGLVPEFVVRAKVAETPGNLKGIKAGDTVWLGWSNEGGGWYQWRDGIMQARPFDTPERALRAASSCPGPWFYKPTPESIEAVAVEYRPASIKIVE
jgi:hypothetical protein